MPKPRFEGVTTGISMYSLINWYRLLNAYGVVIGLFGIEETAPAFIAPPETVSVILNY